MNSGNVHVDLVRGSKPRLTEPPKYDLVKGSKAIADALGIDQMTCLKLIHQGDLPAFQLGNTMVIRREMFDAWLALKEMKALAGRMK